MKQIKLFMFLLCSTLANLAFAQVEPVPPITTQYVATYTWTGAGANANWTNAANWSLVHNAPVGTNPPLFPNIATVGANTTATINVVVPVNNLNGRYPTLVTNGQSQVYSVSDLQIDAGASVVLNGRTLIIDGILTGAGQLVGGGSISGFGVTTVLKAEGKNKVNFYTDAAKHAATFTGTSYTEDFVGFVGDLNGGPVPTVFVGTDFIDPAVPATGYAFNGKALPGGLMGIEPTPGQVKMSTKVELEELLFTFDPANNPVYNISAEFSVTDFDGTAMTFGKLIDEDLDPNTPALDVRNNSMNVTVSLLDGSTHNYVIGASGTVLGISAQQPIVDVTVTSLVQVGAGLVFVGYQNVEDFKIGNRVPFGNLNFNQTGTGNQLLELHANLAPSVGSMTIASPLQIIGDVYPTSGNIVSTPAGSAAGTANLTLLSSANRT
ncbi:MAG: hypothetical protein RL642_389, partial [Bacteroidota bacterium]